MPSASDASSSIEPPRLSTPAAADSQAMAVSLYPYVPPLLPDEEGIGAEVTAESAEELQELRLRSVAHNCRSLLLLLRIEDGDEFHQSLGTSDGEGTLTLAEFLAQYLSTIGSIAENCDWDQDEDGAAAYRWRVAENQPYTNLVDPMGEFGSSGGEVSPTQVARAAMAAVASSPEDRKLAHLVWEVVNRLTQTQIPGFLSAKSLIDFVQM